MVLVGRQVRFVASVESFQSLRIGSRVGCDAPGPPHRWGRTILAALPAETLDQLYPTSGTTAGELGPTASATLRRDLARIRKQGYAVNNGETERGVTAVGTLVADLDGPLAAVSVSIPTIRYAPEDLPVIVGSLRNASEQIVATLRA
jgi:DNA-binding IclR family transcriptional regulator